MEVIQKKTFNYRDTTATKKIFALRKRIRGVAGGTSASKTISILIWLINYCQTKQSRVKLASVVSQSYPHLEMGAMLDFANIMKDRGYWNQDRWHDTKHRYTFETGNKLEFFSPDTFSKAKGPRRDVLYINEGDHLSYITADQLIIRTREVVWVDWNPTYEYWFYTEFLQKRDDVDFITLNYLDNEALDEQTVKEIESHKDDDEWWRVYGLGLMGQRTENIYSHFKPIDHFPEGGGETIYGLDFGFNNPTALVEILYRDTVAYVQERLYESHLTNSELIEKLKYLIPDKNCLIYADAAEPQRIEEIRQAGFRIESADKSVKDGIDSVKQTAIFVTRNSVNVWKEYNSYKWRQDKDGHFYDEPVKFNDHSLDALRYAIHTHSLVMPGHYTILIK